MLRDEVIEIFVKVDDFCKEIIPILEEKRIEDKKLGKRCRKIGLCESELISLMVLFHSGQFRNLKSFYVHYALPHFKDLFPGMTSRELAKRGQCSIGWFYVFKLHLIINDKGNIDDRNLKHMMDMTKDIFGKLYGDKGYISKAMADILWGNGIQMVTKPRKNMKGLNLSETDKIMLRKRAIIECVND